MESEALGWIDVLSFGVVGHHGNGHELRRHVENRRVVRLADLVNLPGVIAWRIGRIKRGKGAG
jgi:hypothetical protein